MRHLYRSELGVDVVPRRLVFITNGSSCPCRIGRCRSIRIGRPWTSPLNKKFRKSAGNDLQMADIQLYVTGPEALTVLHHVIGRAECRLDVLMYLWDSDPLGEEVAQPGGPGQPSARCVYLWTAAAT